MTPADRGPAATPAPAGGSVPDFSLVREDRLHAAQRLTHLVPRQGFGLVRRIAILIALTWLPLVIAAAWNRHVLGGSEPLLQHFGVHVRFLVAIPLFILAEPLAERLGRRVIAYFLESGLVAESGRASFVATVESCRRLLRSPLALLAVVGFAGLQSALSFRDLAHMHEIQGWAVSPGGDGYRLALGAWWFLLVSRPIYGVFLFNWIWRLIVAVVLLARIARLDLQLVPTHPDGCGGLGFLQNVPTAFAPVIVASSAVLASRWGHDVLYHQVPVQSLRLPMVLFVALVLVLFLAPLLVFAPALLRLKRRSLLAYGVLVGRHGRLVERRWVRGETVVDDGLLEAPELGPVADTLALYDAIQKLRMAPIGKQSIVTVAGAAILPMLPVVAIEVPIKEHLLNVIRVLL